MAVGELLLGQLGSYSSPPEVRYCGSSRGSYFDGSRGATVIAVGASVTPRRIGLLPSGARQRGGGREAPRQR